MCGVRGAGTSARALISDLGHWAQCVLYGCDVDEDGSSIGRWGILRLGSDAGSDQSCETFDGKLPIICRSSGIGGGGSASSVGGDDYTGVSGSSWAFGADTCGVGGAAVRARLLHVGTALLHYAVQAGWPETAHWLMSVMIGPRLGALFEEVKEFGGMTVAQRAALSLSSVR